MKNEDKITPDAHLVYLTKLTPPQITEQLKKNISDAAKSETFTEALKSGFHFEGTVSESSFHLKTKGKTEYTLKGQFFKESDYTKVEVVFEYDNFISKKWRKLLLIITAVLFVGLGSFIFVGQRDDLWVVLALIGLFFFTLLSPNHKDKYLISSHKKRLGKILDAYEFREE